MKTNLVLFCKAGQEAVIITPGGQHVRLVFRGIRDDSMEIAFRLPVGFELKPRDYSETIATVIDQQSAQGWIPESRLHDYLGAKAAQAHQGG